MKNLKTKLFLALMAVAVGLTTACGGGGGGGGSSAPKKVSEMNVEQKIDHMDNRVEALANQGRIGFNDNGVYLAQGLSAEELKETSAELKEILKVGEMVLAETKVSSPAEFNRENFARAVEQLRDVANEAAAAAASSSDGLTPITE